MAAKPVKEKLIQYRDLIHYKYLLLDDYRLEVNVTAKDKDVELRFLKLTVDGQLTILKGYAWDGPSGPAIDTKNFMRGSLVHDALYQLIREGVVDEKYRKNADLMLRKICLEDGMHPFRAFYSYWAIRIFYPLFSLFNQGTNKEKHQTFYAP